MRNTPSHGDTYYTANAHCNDGNITLRDESSTISCHAGYNLQAGSCVALTPTNPTPPANCTAGSQNGYAYNALNHNATQTVTKTQNGTPANGTTNYTATATCDNGTVTILGESSVVHCDSGYNRSGNVCIAVCMEQIKDGYHIPTLNDGSSKRVGKAFLNMPQNGTTHYGATAVCDNGNIRIE